jgi:hypothetical protein
MASLSSLPVELLTQITEDLPRQTLRNLRLQNKQLANVMCKYLFQSVNVKMTPDSVQRFFNVVHSESLVKFVTTLFFDRRTFELTDFPKPYAAFSSILRDDPERNTHWADFLVELYYSVIPLSNSNTELKQHSIPDTEKNVRSVVFAQVRNSDLYVNCDPLPNSLHTSLEY